MRLMKLNVSTGRSLRDFYKSKAAFIARVLTRNAEIAIGYVIRRVVNAGQVLFHVATCTNATKNEWTVYAVDKRNIVQMDPLS